MDETVNEFFVTLPSNASMQYFPRNNQSSYRTKLFSPLILSGSWEVGLSEIFIPRNWFNVGEHNNDYVITANVEKIVNVEFSRRTFSFNYGVLVSVNAPVSKEEFFLNLNENIKETLNIAHSVQFIPEQTGNMIHIVVAKGFEVHISRKYASKMLQMFSLPEEDLILKETKKLRFIPLSENKDQLFSIINRNPIKSHHYLIPLTPITGYEPKDVDVFNVISRNILDLNLQNYITFIFDKEQYEVEIKISANVELHIDKARAPSFLQMLNELNDIVISETKKFKITPPIIVQEGDCVDLIVKEYPKIILSEKKTNHFNVSIGMYKSAESLFHEFHHIHMRQLPNSKTFLEVPSESEVTFGRGLADMLGFVNNHFKSGEYISDYALELNAGITEIFVYSDLIESHHIGDTFAPLLRIIPCMNEKNEQIVKHYEKPIYFPLRNNFVDTIEMELRTASGKNITFMGGKTFVLLSFRRNKSIN